MVLDLKFLCCRSIHDVKATDMGAHSVRFKAEVNFDGREVAKLHVDKLDLENLMKVHHNYGRRGSTYLI